MDRSILRYIPSFRKIYRVIFSSLKGFLYDGCFLKASSLTYYSMLSIVPVLAVIFGIAKGFGFEQTIKSDILVILKDHPAVAAKIIDFIQQTLIHAKGGVIAGLGVLFLFWTVWMLLWSIELAFNDIWKIKSYRSFWRMFGDYLAVVIFCPVFLITSSSLSVYIFTKLTVLAQETGTSVVLSPFIGFLIQATPYLFSWLLFSFLYLYMPNKQVSIRYALGSGIFAGTVYQLLQIFYFQVQVNITSYNAIYGSFAALPLFLLWIQLSWWIALYGAELAYHMEYDQKEFAYKDLLREVREDVPVVSVALYIILVASENFLSHKHPMSVVELSEDLGVPYSKALDLVKTLADAELLLYVEGKEDIFQINASPSSILVTDVIGAISPCLVNKISVNPSSKMTQISLSWNSIESKWQKLPDNITFFEMLTRSDNAIP